MTFDPTQLQSRLKHGLVNLVDLALIPISLYGALAMRLSTPTPWELPDASNLVLVIICVLCVPLLFLAGNYRIRLRDFDIRAIARLALTAAAAGVIAAVTAFFSEAWLPRSAPVMFAGVYFALMVISRAIAHGFIDVLSKQKVQREAVVIYGAGSAGSLLAKALKEFPHIKPVVFVDDNPKMQGKEIAGLPVKSPSVLDELVRSESINRILIAIPSLTNKDKSRLLATLRPLNCDVQIVPSYLDLMSGRRDVTELRPVRPVDLLDRTTVDLDQKIVLDAFRNKVIMVTGAGGSIGSELCRQLLDCMPSKIILFEQNENNLYKIDASMRTLLGARQVGITSVLGSVTDRDSVLRELEARQVDVVLHAAAYKHVPIIEKNPFPGVRNNVLGTRIIAECAAKAGVERFVLVSTDKAVRPANIMGATKRLAEIVVQDLQEQYQNTVFTSVRFGNVIGSSGSVVPLFRKQLEAGGPITVTHPDVTRYFMTIPEASRLVLLAGAYARGGDVFLLDMGEPIRIVDLARRIIQLSGLTERTTEYPEGDIEIKFVGLRPGEKLHEELLINHSNGRRTAHPKILTAVEDKLKPAKVSQMIEALETAVDEADLNGVHTVMMTFVDSEYLDLPVQVSGSNVSDASGFEAVAKVIPMPTQKSSHR